MTGHRIAAMPHGAAAFSGTGCDLDVREGRLLEPEVVMPILRLRSQRLVRVDRARVVVDFGPGVGKVAHGRCARARSAGQRKKCDGDDHASHSGCPSFRAALESASSDSVRNSDPYWPSTPIRTSHFAPVAICSIARPSGAPAYLSSRYEPITMRCA